MWLLRAVWGFGGDEVSLWVVCGSCGVNLRFYEHYFSDLL